ncbi:MAG: bifunctional oligoribonuclease/PAP phosphatase NrnA [Clostridia bacterium]|nr:bifunctional oligoribonuclease/PAP phosphatase NrnA [Clostridia bacterium]MBQ8743516.1 bifunctional oligoribonuclease/PAP phosphatase NrnA [Clostridia bacterium]
MNKSIKHDILDSVKKYEKIVIIRHKKPDGDAVGASLGLKEILRSSFPEKDVRVINSDRAESLDFLGDEDPSADDSFYSGALAVIVDTSTVERISNPKYTLCERVIKIDHHADSEAYGDISWVEGHRSSCSEMIADLYSAFPSELSLGRDAARAIYTGIVTDSGRFRFSSVSGDTHRLTAMLLDTGIDLDVIHANLYMREFHTFKFQASVYKKMQISENGVAYLYIDREMQDEFSLSYEDAGNAVIYMESIKNSLIWIAFIENRDSSVRVRLRSRFVTVNTLAEKYRGGGHACACGATVYSRDEAEKLVKEADLLLKKYKEENEGWL